MQFDQIVNSNLQPYFLRQFFTRVFSLALLVSVIAVLNVNVFTQEVREVRKKFYNNGKLMEESEWLGYRRDGFYKKYSRQTGQLEEVGQYKLGAKDGVWKHYFHGTKSVQHIREYKNGYKTGIWKEFYKSGAIKKETPYEPRENGGSVVQGIVREYWENGEFRYVGSFIESKEHGIHKRFSGQGKLWREIPFEMGVRHGIWKEYYDNSQINYEYRIVRGVQEGQFTRYCEDGRIKEQGYYKNNKKEGDWKVRRLNCDGEFVTMRYENGRKVRN